MLSLQWCDVFPLSGYNAMLHNMHKDSSGALLFDYSNKLCSYAGKEAHRGCESAGYIRLLNHGPQPCSTLDMAEIACPTWVSTQTTLFVDFPRNDITWFGVKPVTSSVKVDNELTIRYADANLGEVGSLCIICNNIDI
ncbi:unnamed protein product [Discosporangium mesarthrocarpum]